MVVGGGLASEIFVIRKSNGNEEQRHRYAGLDHREEEE